MQLDCAQRSADAGALALLGRPLELRGLFSSLLQGVFLSRSFFLVFGCCLCSGPGKDKMGACAVVRAVELNGVSKRKLLDRL
jgi:hypothetical protein